MWVRGLKQEEDQQVEEQILSHPMWVRGLKLFIAASAAALSSRTLCGCVD